MFHVKHYVSNNVNIRKYKIVDYFNITLQVPEEAKAITTNSYNIVCSWCDIDAAYDSIDSTIKYPEWNSSHGRLVLGTCLPFGDYRESLKIL